MRQCGATSTRRRALRAAFRPRAPALANESWLPPPSPKEAGLKRPWEPEGLRRTPAGRLSYVVLEEIIEDSIGLSVSCWPEVDEGGRLFFAQTCTIVRGDRAWLEEQV